MPRKQLFQQSGIPLRYVFIALCVISISFILQEYVGFTYRAGEGEEFGWGFTATATLTTYLSWILFCPLIYRLSKNFGSGKSVTLIEVIGLLLLSVVVAFFHRVVASLLLYIVLFISRGEWYGHLNNHTYSAIFADIFTSMLFFWLLIGLYVAATYYQKYQEKQIQLIRMENELNNAQLQALKMQLHPHFLFNALHTTSSMIDENTEHAQKMISQIGYLLRSMLESEKKQTIALREELRYVRCYLDIEQTRFRDRLKIEYDIARDTMQLQVPNMILQPLVENAIKHGFSRRTDSGKIVISSRLDNGKLILTVEDDGRGVRSQRALKGNGIGLQNVRGRLAQMYKDQAYIEVNSNNGSGCVAKIVLPHSTNEKRRRETT